MECEPRASAREKPGEPRGSGQLRERRHTPVRGSVQRTAAPRCRGGRAALGAREPILLGSIVIAKYVDVLLSVFTGRLLFPAEFVGRGNMSRGGLMLRRVRRGRRAHVRAGAER